MKRIYKQFVLAIFFILLCSVAVMAQPIKVELKITKLSSNYADGDSYGSRFRFSGYTSSLLYYPCIKRPENFTQDENILLYPIWLPNVTTSFNIVMTTHNERKKDSDDCSAQGVSDVSLRKPDLHEASSTPFSVTLGNYIPGKFVPLGKIQIDFEGTSTYADLEIRYTIPTPEIPTISGTGFCADGERTLNTEVKPNRNGLIYEWQYALPEEDYEIPNPDKDPRNYNDPMYGCGHMEIDEVTGWEYWVSAYDCDLPSTVMTHNWRRLSISNSQYDNFATFTPLNQLFGGTLTEKKNVSFRVRAVSSDGQYSSWSAEKPLTFLPPAPTVFADKLIKKPSCVSTYNGQIQIPAAAMQTPHIQVRWILKNKPAGDVPCSIIINPDGTITSSCGMIERASDGLVTVPKTNYDAPIVVDNVPPGDYYLWVVNPGENMGNCYSAISVTVPQYEELQLIQDAAGNVSCFGGTNGSLKVHAAGGDAVSGYQFKLTATKNTHLNTDFTTIAGGVWELRGLPADTYRIELKNICSPVKWLDITITQPIEIKAELANMHPSCATPVDGRITATVTQGGGNYVFQLWKEGALINETPSTATTHSWEPLAAGAYTVKVLDADRVSCTPWSGTTVLAPPPPIEINVLATETVSCFGGSDGKLTVTAKGGKGSYGYRLKDLASGSNSENTTGTFTGLTAGNYELTIYNEPAGGCTDNVIKTVTITQRDPLAITVSTTPVTCKGDDNGAIKATVTGGSGSYEYQWQFWDGTTWKNNPFWFSTDTEITSLTPGRYRVIVKDRESALTCVITSEEVTITEPAHLQIDNITITDAVCKADGARIALTASGGNGSYQYHYSTDGRTTYTLFDAGTPILTSGTYALKLTDSKGCTVESDDEYSMIVPSASLDFSSTLSNFNGKAVSCKGAADGRIQVTATGGNEGSYTGYQYQLNTGSFQASPVFDNLPAGTYTISVRDGRGCLIAKTITLTEPETLRLAITATDINCFGASSGAITAAIEGGTAAYVIKMNGETVMPGTFNNLTAGNYSFNLQDANACVFNTTVTLVNKFPVLAIESVAAPDIKCFGQTTTISVVATGGNGVYTYHYSNDNGTTWKPFTVATPFVAGTYKLKVTDGMGCTTVYTESVVINAPTEPLDFTYTLSDYNGYNISCYGGSNGWAQLVATGGNSRGYTGYAYAWKDGAYQTAPLLENINVGTHQLKVKDGRGCIVSKVVIFTQSTLALSVALVSKQDVTCRYDRNGAITVKGTGGTGTLRYALNGGTPQDAPVFTGLAEGYYTVAVIDANNCSNSFSVTIGTVNPPITISKVEINDIVCKGDKGSIALAATGGTGSLTFEYAREDEIYKSFSSGALFNAGQHQLQVKDAAGCIQPWTAPVIITEPAAPLAFTTESSQFNGVNISCFGNNDGTIQVKATGGNGHAYTGYTYAIDGIPFAGSAHFSNLVAGTYKLQVKDGRGCVVAQNITMVQPAASLTLSLASKTDVLCAGAATGVVELEAHGGTPPYQYSKDGSTFQAAAAFTSLPAGTYHFTVQDANGCNQPLTVTIIELHTALTATHTMQPVNCFSGTDGQVQLTVNGGLTPYTYLWSGTAQNTAHLQNVPAGSYTATITDAAGCIHTYSALVTQPAAALTAALVTKPACAGSAGGHIEFKAKGGTQPYKYSIDNGSSFHEESTFTSLVAGTYAVVVKDKNACTYKTNTVIAPANAMPVVNFLVASRQNALDTLVIREVSVPAPDSVAWAFHTDAIVIRGQGLVPQIRFRQPGSYWVSMKGYFKGCDYTLRKLIEVKPYDPVAGPVTAMAVRVIDTAMLSPNPNNGQFDVQVRLHRKQKVILQVLQLGTGKEILRKGFEGTLLIDDRFALGNIAGGSYVLRVITENDSQDVFFVIAR